MGVSLVARDLRGPWYVSDLWAGHPALYTELILSTDPSQPLISSVFHRLKSAPNFPYGVPVDPDN